MEKEFPQSVSDEEWKEFSGETKNEVFLIYQKEIKDRLLELIRYVENAPDDLPQKELLSELAQAVEHTVNSSIYATPEKTREHLLDYLDRALEPLGYETIEKLEKFKLETRASLRGDEPWLNNKAAAKAELERLQPWAERGIGDERANARAAIELIYERFPDLRG